MAVSPLESALNAKRTGQSGGRNQEGIGGWALRPPCVRAKGFLFDAVRGRDSQRVTRGGRDIRVSCEAKEAQDKEAKCGERVQPVSPTRAIK